MVTLNGNIINNINNNIAVTTARCVCGSGAWTGKNLILDEGLLGGRVCSLDICLVQGMHRKSDHLKSFSKERPEKN